MLTRASYTCSDTWAAITAAADGAAEELGSSGPTMLVTLVHSFPAVSSAGYLHSVRSASDDADLYHRIDGTVILVISSQPRGQGVPAQISRQRGSAGHGFDAPARVTSHLKEFHCPLRSPPGPPSSIR